MLHVRKRLTILFAVTLTAALLLLFVPAASAATLVVGPGQTYTTIQSAIDAAGVDDIIEVQTGTYTEDLSIPAGKDNLEIMAAAAATPVIKGVQNVPQASWPLAAPNIEVLSSGVHIHGFTIDSPDYAAGFYTSGMVIGAANVEVADNDFVVTPAANSDEVSQAIQTYSAAAVPGVDVSGLSIHDNTFTNLAGASGGYEGIYLNLDAGTGLATLQNNTFAGQLCRGMTTERSNVTILGNDVITDLAPNTSPAAAPGWQGINVGNGKDVSDIQALFNTIRGSAPGAGFGYGMRLRPATTLTNVAVSFNTIAMNTYGIDVLAVTTPTVLSGVTVNGNEISGNTTGVRNDTTGTELDATGNYWGSDNGPQHASNTFNAGSQGNPVSDNVDFIPWRNTSLIGPLFTPVTRGTDGYASIQSAIDAAGADDIIAVKTGTYTEDLSIPAGKNNLEIMAADAATPVIKGVQNVPQASWPLAAPNIEVLSSGVSIHGFTIDSPDYAAGYYTSGMVIGAANVEIYGNDFRVTPAANSDEVSQAIQTYAAAAVPGVDISGLNIHDNTFTDLAGASGGYEGIYLNLDAGSGLATLQDNSFGGQLCRAMTTERSNVTILGNDVITDLAPNTDPTTAPGWQGINVGNTKDVSDVNVTNNTIGGSAPGAGFGYGVRLRPATTMTNVSLGGNTITMNVYGVHVSAGAGGATVSGNEISGNTTGVQNTDAAALDAIGNYWGTDNGPQHATNTYGLGSQGNPVIGNVEFIPWRKTSLAGPLFTPVTLGTDGYASIQSAIDAASASDLIEVQTGTFTEDLSIPAGKDNLELAAAATATPTIKGVQNAPIASWPLAAPNIEVLSDGVSIHGFTIDSPDYAAGYYTSGMVIGARNVEIYGNDFEVTPAANSDEVSQAIQTYAAAAVPGVNVSGLNIHNNTFTNLAGASGGYEGIYLNLDAGTGLATLQNNTFGGQLCRGMTTERSNVTILSNDVITDLAPNISPAAAPGWQGINVGNGKDVGSVQILLNTIRGSAPGAGFGYGMRLRPATTLTNVAVSSNTITMNTYGIDVLAVTTPTDLSNVTINNNEISGNTTGVRNDATGTELDATGNYWGSDNGPQQASNTFNVGSQGNPVSDNVDFTPWRKTSMAGPLFSPVTLNATDGYASIQSAIDAAGADAVIGVETGIFTEDLSIPDGKGNLELKAADTATPVIKGVQNVPQASWPLAAPNIEVLSNDVAIHGFTIDSPDYTAGYYTSGMVIGAQNVEIYGNDFRVTPAANSDEVSQAIQTYAAAAVPGVDVSGLNIHDNTFTDLAGASGGYEGIYLNVDTEPAADQVIIENNTFGGQLCRGITTERSNVLITGNDIITDLAPNINPDTAPGWQGINVGNGRDVSEIDVTNNTIQGSAPGAGFGYGIRMRPFTTLTNVAVGDAVLGGNTITMNVYGIDVLAVTTPTTPTVLTGVTVNYNDIYGNATGVRNDTTGTELDARYNWWGSFTGPYNAATNPSGTGDAVTDNVDYRPWSADAGQAEIVIEPPAGWAASMQGGYLAIPSTSTEASTPYVHVLDDVILEFASLNVPGGNDVVTIPAGAMITRSGGGNINATALTAGSVLLDDIAGYPEDLTPLSAIELGLDGVSLAFSQSVSMEVWVGTEMNGRAVNMMRSLTGQSSWTNGGMNPWSTTVASGKAASAAGFSQFFGVFLPQTPIASEWYIAEGSTGADGNGGSFETWITVQNPGTADATVTLTYLTDNGEEQGPTVPIPGKTRKSFNVADTVPNTWSVSTIVSSTQPVIAERSVYWNAPGAFRQAANGSIGVGQ